MIQPLHIAHAGWPARNRQDAILGARTAAMNPAQDPKIPAKQTTPPPGSRHSVLRPGQGSEVGIDAEPHLHLDSANPLAELPHFSFVNQILPGSGRARPDD